MLRARVLAALLLVPAAIAARALRPTVAAAAPAASACDRTDADAGRASQLHARSCGAPAQPGGRRLADESGGPTTGGATARSTRSTPATSPGCARRGWSPRAPSTATRRRRSCTTASCSWPRPATRSWPSTCAPAPSCGAIAGRWPRRSSRATPPRGASHSWATRCTWRPTTRSLWPSTCAAGREVWSRRWPRTGAATT